MVRQNGRALEYASMDIREEIVTAGVKSNYEALRWASDRLKDNMAIAEEHIKHSGLGPKLFKDTKIIRQAIRIRADWMDWAEWSACWPVDTPSRCRRKGTSKFRNYRN